MMPEIIVLPRQNDDSFKNMVFRKLNKQFRFPLDGSLTIVLYKPQGRPLDGVEENLSPVLKSRERLGQNLMIFVHDTYIPQDMLTSLERKWDCKVSQWRNEADWKTICQYLEGFMKKKSYLELMYDCLQRHVPSMKGAIFLLCFGGLAFFSIYIWK